jgi:hypothetical protein
MKLIIVIWFVLVASVVVCKAQDSAGSVEIPAGCHLPASSMLDVHAILCHEDTECTQRVVDVLCDYNTGKK